MRACPTCCASAATERVYVSAACGSRLEALVGRLRSYKHLKSETGAYRPDEDAALGDDEPFSVGSHDAHLNQFLQVGIQSGLINPRAEVLVLGCAHTAVLVEVGECS